MNFTSMTKRVSGQKWCAYEETETVNVKKSQGELT